MKFLASSGKSSEPIVGHRHAGYEKTRQRIPKRHPLDSHRKEPSALVVKNSWNHQEQLQTNPSKQHTGPPANRIRNLFGIGPNRTSDKNQQREDPNPKSHFENRRQSTLSLDLATTAPIEIRTKIGVAMGQVCTKVLNVPSIRKNILCIVHLLIEVKASRVPEVLAYFPGIFTSGGHGMYIRTRHMFSAIYFCRSALSIRSIKTALWAAFLKNGW